MSQFSIAKEQPLDVWQGRLRPVDGQENQPFSVTKYLHIKGTSKFFLVDLEINSVYECDQSKVVIKGIFPDSYIGKKILKDIENKFGQMIMVGGESQDDKAKEGLFVRKMRGRFVDVPLGSTYDIHAVDAAGNPITNNQGDPIIAKNRTTEPTFLFKDESISEAASRMKTRIANNPKRYVLVADSGADDADIIANTAPGG